MTLDDALRDIESLEQHCRAILRDGDAALAAMNPWRAPIIWLRLKFNLYLLRRTTGL